MQYRYSFFKQAARAERETEVEHLQVESDLACICREGAAALNSSSLSQSSPTKLVDVKDGPAQRLDAADRLAQYRADRLVRIEKFLTYMERKNDAKIRKLVESLSRDASNVDGLTSPQT